RHTRFSRDWSSDVCSSDLASWVGEDKVHCWALGEVDGPTMLREFKRLYDEADGVTGHYIRKHDLPIINGALLEHGLPLLGPKMRSEERRVGKASRYHAERC